MFALKLLFPDGFLELPTTMFGLGDAVGAEVRWRYASTVRHILDSLLSDDRMRFCRTVNKSSTFW